jgi:2-phosphosulfolactate phosphatase
VLTAAFVNLEAVVRRLARETTIQVICAGTEGAITREDALCAGALVAICQQRWQAEPANDEAALVADAWRHHFSATDPIDSARLTDLLAASQGGRNLRDRGFGEDVARCAAVNQIAAIPQRVGRDPIRITGGGNRRPPRRHAASPLG